MKQYDFRHSPESESLSYMAKTSSRNLIFEGIDDPATDAAAADFSEKHLRAVGMSVLIDWSGAGDFSYDALDLLVQAVSDLDESGDIERGSIEELLYNSFFQAVANAAAFLGAGRDDIRAFLDDEQADAGRRVGLFLSDKLNTIDLPDDQIIANYAMTSPQMVTESMVKAVRGGEVTLVKKRRHIAYKITAAMRAALKKARSKAHSSVAKFNLRRSLHARKQHGLK